MTLKHLFVAATLVASACASHAGGSALTLLPTGPGQAGVSFTQVSDGFFVDTFDIAPLSFGGTVSVNLFSDSGLVEFYVASLNGADFSFFPEDGPLNNVSFQASFSANTPFQLTVLGAGTSIGDDGFPVGPVTYSGTITAAIPEPETYALMLAGLIGVGLAARRQSTRRVASIG